MGTGERMKTIVLTESQLKELLETGKVTTTEPVKKGERYIEHWEAPLSKLKGKLSIPAMIHNGEKTINHVGELVQAVNEKGERQWFCPNCKQVDAYVSQGLELPNNKGKHQQKLLLGRLDKIEKKEMMVLAKDVLVELKGKQYGNLKTIKCWLYTLVKE